jgi:drug/metabolite transporter (DMT)-like permease
MEVDAQHRAVVNEASADATAPASDRSVPSSTDPAAKTRMRGILSMLLAVGAFSCMDALLKFLTEHYPTMQVSAMRGVASLPFILVPLLFTGRFAELKPVRWKLHVMRGLLAVLLLGTFVYSIRVLSLADAYAIFLSAPLIITALSVPVLGERVGWHRWLAIIIGLCGVMVMLRPSGEALLSVGAIAAFISAVAYAINAVAVRVLTRTDSNTAVVFWSMAIMTTVSALLALSSWQPVRPEHFIYIVATGIVGAVALHMLTQAFRSAPVSVIAPFEYTALLWGVGIDWLIWDTLPKSRFYIGASIVLLSGLYVIWRESRPQFKEPSPSQ